MNEFLSLFKYELAIVAILKNEAPYIKEWIDYHLLAGVNHFYLYDNESEDNLKDILQPYIINGIVDYEFISGRCAQNLVYNMALQKYRFSARYITLLDADEFIYPRNNKSIVEVVDSIIGDNPNVGGLTVNWQIFGSSGHDKADLTTGVLERFLHHAPVKLPKYLLDKLEKMGQSIRSIICKIIVNPRCVHYVISPHFAIYFDGKNAINENRKFVVEDNILEDTVDKIGINHYYTKSKEEFIKKRNRGKADLTDLYDMAYFDLGDRNEIYDDGILAYREARRALQDNHIESIQEINLRRKDALLKYLSPALSNKGSTDFYKGRVCEFLTCAAVARDLKSQEMIDFDANFFEEVALNCLHESLVVSNIALWQAELLIDELPKLLKTSYPIIKNIKKACMQFISQLMNLRRMQPNWHDFKRLEYIYQLLDIK